MGRQLEQPRQQCLVTGGAGFLGRHLVAQLLESGKWDVSVFDVRDAAIPSVDNIVGDLRNMDDIMAACKGKHVVFHTAAVAPTTDDNQNYDLMNAVNVTGTSNVVAACRAQGVPKLVYTSSASVVFEGNDLVGVNEDQPYASRPLDFYTKTKVLGEMVVLSANGQEGLSTVALRPSGIFGPGDPLFVPTLVEKARQGKMKYIIGSGTNVMDFTYVGNVAQAHLLAADKLDADSPVAGRAYFVTNDDAQPFWGFIGDMLEPLGYGRPRIKLPFSLIFFLACVMELLIMPLFKLLGRPIAASAFTRNRIKLAAANRRFNVARAKRDLGYEPAVDIPHAVQLTVDSFRHLSASADDDAKSKLR